jgi:hypothetical protein
MVQVHRRRVSERLHDRAVVFASPVWRRCHHFFIRKRVLNAAQKREGDRRRRRRTTNEDDGDLSFEFFFSDYYGEKTNARSFFKETTSFSLFIRTRDRTHESALLVRLVLFDAFSSFLPSSRARVCFKKKSEVNQERCD